MKERSISKELYRLIDIALIKENLLKENLRESASGKWILFFDFFCKFFLAEEIKNKIYLLN